ncbi:hypothetical protein [Ferrimonas aestuarii]|uniref:Uncharacterized protein n=1 Tax=Ferrimonas aestuarii TaxID=2569539 RepID=A0A4U1BL69_9GAMM|nr:hypothetical protein [Ferrimonas aestuarii]TKB52022.1 hypothetical protein FCL42_16525 [Ferrimonas aestuarii]
MLEQLESLWSEYTTIDVPELKGVRLRRASSRKKASILLYPPKQPIGEFRMLSNIDVHCGWECPVNLRWAKGLNINEQSETLRDIQLKALENAVGAGQYPYLLWFYREKSPKKRAIYTDSVGASFIKLNSVWQVVYNCRELGTLVGAQGHKGEAVDYEKLPPNAYFVVMENEAVARRHSAS